MAKLLTLLNVILIPKGHDLQINEYLHSREIQCKCRKAGCHYTIVNAVHVSRFYKLRKEVGFPLYINSGYRCQTHNKHVGGVENSSHTTGNGTDIDTSGLWLGQKNKLVEEAKKLYDYVKVYDKFIHCQTNPAEEGGKCV